MSFVSSECLMLIPTGTNFSFQTLMLWWVDFLGSKVGELYGDWWVVAITFKSVKVLFKEKGVAIQVY